MLTLADQSGSTTAGVKRLKIDWILFSGASRLGGKEVTRGVFVGGTGHLHGAVRRRGNLTSSARY